MPAAPAGGVKLYKWDITLRAGTCNQTYSNNEFVATIIKLNESKYEIGDVYKIVDNELHNYTVDYDTGEVSINGNSGLNLRNGSGIIDAKGKQLMSAIIGKGSKDKGVLGKVAYENYGIGGEGFDVVSNMFSTHYFFENVEMLNEYFGSFYSTIRIQLIFLIALSQSSPRIRGMGYHQGVYYIVIILVV